MSAAVAAASTSQPGPSASLRAGPSIAQAASMRGRAPGRPAPIRSTPAASASETSGVRNHATSKGLRPGALTPAMAPRYTTASLQRVGAEEHPADHHHDEQIRVAEWRWQTPDQPGEAQSLRDEERPVVQAPDDEVPARAVPQTAQEEHQDEVAVHPSRADAVAAERDVQVIAEPRRERDVPAAPELLDGVGDVRPPEVLGEPEAEHPPEADRHVGVARKIEVDLQRVADDPEPRVGRASAPRARSAKMPSAAVATLFAIRTFLPSPTMKRRTPAAKSSRPTTRRASWSAISR